MPIDLVIDERDTKSGDGLGDNNNNSSSNGSGGPGGAGMGGGGGGTSNGGGRGGSADTGHHSDSASTPDHQVGLIIIIIIISFLNTRLLEISIAVRMKPVIFKNYFACINFTVVSFTPPLDFTKINIYKSILLTLHDEYSDDSYSSSLLPSISTSSYPVMKNFTDKATSFPVPKFIWTRTPWRH